MQVILLEKIRKLGTLGESVNVKPGFARNFLIPTGKAVFATEANLEMVEAKRAEFEKAEAAALKEAQQRAEKLQALQIVMKVQTSDEGKLYGSIGVREIANAITEAGMEVEKSEVRLPEGPIHYVGKYEITLQLHSDVSALVNVTVNSDKPLREKTEESTESEGTGEEE